MRRRDHHRGIKGRQAQLLRLGSDSQQEGRSVSRRTHAAVTARSYHNGIVHVLLIDGSARAISDSIELSVWSTLGTRSGGEPSVAY